MMSRRYFEDVAVGENGVTEHCEVTEEGVLHFAEQFDPQPFHLDHAAAEASLFGRLVGSGWQTVALANRLLMRDALQDLAIAGAAGFDDLRWRSPLYPQDNIRCRYRVSDSRIAPDSRFGELELELEVVNQDDQVVMSATWLPWIARRQDNSGGT